MAGLGFLYVLGAQILFFIVTIMLILYLIRKNKDPKKILDGRLASGEISKKEYNQLIKFFDSEEEK